MNIKKLGFGTMRLPSLDPNNPSNIDIEQLKKMVDCFMERGFTYFDTAWMYCDFASERAVKEALTSRYPRDSYTVTTKLHGDFVTSKEDRDKIFYAQLEKTGLDYFDYYFLHDVKSSSIDIFRKNDCYNWLKEKKAQGLVKKIGFSFHDKPEMLEELLNEFPEMDVVQLQINYLDWESENIQARGNYEVAVKHGLPVIVMEPVKGGTLAMLPPEIEATLKARNPNMSAASWAIRFVASLENVMVVLSGMSNMEQMLDNTEYMMNFEPLTEEEKAMLLHAADVINSKIAIPCTGCSYCTDGCPQNIAIPKYFSLYNEDQREVQHKDKLFTVQSNYYNSLITMFGKASDCIGCGQCENICPQHLPIINNLKLVASHFEG